MQCLGNVIIRYYTFSLVDLSYYIYAVYAYVAFFRSSFNAPLSTPSIAKRLVIKPALFNNLFLAFEGLKLVCFCDENSLTLQRQGKHVSSDHNDNNRYSLIPPNFKTYV